MKTTMACALLGVMLYAADAGSATAQGAGDGYVTALLKFVPEHGLPSEGAVRFDAGSCPACKQLHDPAFERHNALESVLQFRLPRERALELTFEVSPKQARRVILNDADLPLSFANGKLTVRIPPLKSDAIWAPALETDIAETGTVLRVETADPLRRGGAYATGRFPELERRAADNLTFALREVIRRLGLGEAVERDHVGTIMVMGFDTNFPAGHEDAPPHVHMHLRWPNNVGTQIGHYYIDSNGLLTENKVGVRAIGAPQRRFPRGQTFTTIDNRGRDVYANTITQEGWLTVERPEVGACLLRPSGTGGFESGVAIDCSGLGSTSVLVSIDLAGGVITVRTGDIIEHFHYDIDTGQLLTRIDAPPIPISARNPE